MGRDTDFDMHYSFIAFFKTQMKNCLCFKSDIHIRPLHRRSPPECDLKCEDNSDDIYSGDCGGESNYNLYEIRKGNHLYIMYEI